jgi:hypothetical protein
MIFLLCDLVKFYAGHKDHVSIPTEQWSQIPAGLRKKIRTIEKKKDGDLKGAYQQARQYADFAAIAGVDKLNTTKAKTVSYNGAKYKISEPSRTKRKGKKYQVTVERSDGRKKTVAWGDSSREDYLVHKDKKRRDNFQSRFAGIKKKDGSKASDDPWGASYYATKYNW